jgi:hypothetical protein
MGRAYCDRKGQVWIEEEQIKRKLQAPDPHRIVIERPRPEEETRTWNAFKMTCLAFGCLAAVMSLYAVLGR